MKTRRRTLAIAAVLLCRALAAESAVRPLPPLPDTLPTDQFAVDTTVPVAASTEPSDAAAQDSAWLAPAEKPAEKPAVTNAPAADAAPPLQRLSRADASQTAATGDGKPITLNLKNADLPAVLQTFTKFSELNKLRARRFAGSSR
jgi:type IV pilus assembly protein PilQ